MSAAIFSDLDGTLIYSSRHIGDASDIVLVERFGGQLQSWMTATAAANLRQVHQLIPFIPVTTRVHSQYARVRLPGGEPEYAILGNGGRIIRGGQEDRDWSARVDDPSWGIQRPDVLARGLERMLAGQPWLKEIRSFEHIICVAAKSGQEPPAASHRALDEFAADHGYTAHRQGRKTHIIPDHITKEAAAAEISRRLNITRTIASGDHHLDTGLMLWADEAIQPAHCTGAPGIRSTALHGVAAGEEITAAFLRFARDM